MRMRVSTGTSGLLLALLLGTAIGQNRAPAPPPDQAKKPKPQAGTGNQGKTDPELQAMVDGAAAAAPEVGADVLIRLAESRKVASRATKIEFLSKAFDLAATAEQPVKRLAMFGGDTPSALLSRAYRLNMDKLSLQSRAVNDLLPLDAAKARELFEEIQFPALSPVGCEERLTYDLDLFYETLGKVARLGFTAKDKLKGRQIALLTPFVGTLQSHAQAKPAAELLVGARLSASDLGQLANAFAGALAQLRGDERSFAATAMGPGGNGISGSVAMLVTTLEAKEISSITLLRALRQYLVSNFGEVRCAETLRGQADNSSLPEAVKYFNQQFRRYLQTAQIAAITEDELKKARIIPRVPPAVYWQSPESKRLATEMRRLRFGDGESRLTDADRTTSAWSSRLTDFVTELEAWQPDNEPAANVFHQKSILYEGLIDLMPSGPEKSKVLQSFVEFLEQNSVQTPTRIEWLVHADDLLSGKRAADDREEVIQAFVSSGDPTLGIYGRLERWEPRNAGAEPEAAATRLRK
jgi:hypothetical protein